MLFADPKVLLYLKAHSLEVYIKGVEEVGEVDFPSVVIKHLEIIDQTKLNELIISFIAKSGLEAQKAVLLLSDEVTFHKRINRDTPEAEKALIEAFFDKVPLDKAHQAKKVLVTDNSLVAVATNKNLYESIINSFSSNNWEIKTATPAIVFGELSNSLEPQLVEDILSANDLLQKDNLLDSNSLEKEESDDNSSSLEKPKKSSHKGVWFGIFLLFIFVLAAGGYAAYKFGYLTRIINKVNPKTVQQPESTTSGNLNKPDSNATITSESTNSAQTETSTKSAELKRDQIKAEVLNGSGIAGQAAKVKDQLIELGYANVTTDNNPEATASSYVEFSSTLTQTLKDQILADLKKIISTLTTSEKESTTTDFTLILGEDIQ